MKITELAQWYDYINQNEKMLFINIVNFDMNHNFLNFPDKTSFKIIEILKFDKNSMLICEKLQNKTNGSFINNDKYFYFMYNLNTGIFSFNYLKLINIYKNKQFL